MNNSEDSLIRMTDFGLSKHLSSVDVLETFVGTPVYMAPEIIAITGSPFDSSASQTAGP